MCLDVQSTGSLGCEANRSSSCHNRRLSLLVIAVKADYRRLAGGEGMHETQMRSTTAEWKLCMSQ